MACHKLQFGVLDICGFEKDYYYYYQSNDRQPCDSWYGPLELKGKEGEKIELRVFSNCEEAQVYLNGKSLGRRHVGSIILPVSEYEPGILEIIGYRAEKKLQRYKSNFKEVQAFNVRR